MCVSMNAQFKLIRLEPDEIPLNVISFLSANSEISKGRSLLVVIYKLHYSGIHIYRKRPEFAFFCACHLGQQAE